MGWNEHLGKDSVRIFLCIRDHLKAMTDLGSRSRGGREIKAVKKKQRLLETRFSGNSKVRQAITF